MLLLLLRVAFAQTPQRKLLPLYRQHLVRTDVNLGGICKKTQTCRSYISHEFTTTQTQNSLIHTYLNLHHVNSVGGITPHPSASHYDITALHNLLPSLVQYQSFVHRGQHRHRL